MHQREFKVAGFNNVMLSVPDSKGICLTAQSEKGLAWRSLYTSSGVHVMPDIGSAETI